MAHATGTVDITDTMLVGFARVSPAGPGTGRQLQALRARGCERIFTDRRSQ